MSQTPLVDTGRILPRTKHPNEVGHSRQSHSSIPWLLPLLLVGLMAILVSNWWYELDASGNIGDSGGTTTTDIKSTDPTGNPVRVSRSAEIPLGAWVGQDIEVSYPGLNRTAIVKVWALSNDYSWVFGSDKNVVLGRLSSVFPSHLNSPGITRDLQRANVVVAIGAASEEGDLVANERLANTRARRLSLWIRESPSVNGALYTLSLGRHHATGKLGRDQTAPQRQVVIAGITFISGTENISDKTAAIYSAIYSALRFGNPMGIALADYSRFEIVQAR